MAKRKKSGSKQSTSKSSHVLDKHFDIPSSAGLIVVGGALFIAFIVMMAR